MSNPFGSALRRVSRVPGVQGVLLVEPEAGLPVLVELAAGVNGSAVAALAASLYLRTAQAAAAAGMGELGTLQLEAEQGHVLVARAGELLLAAVADQDAQLARVRLEVEQAAETLR
jgi:predicted regulator of Ras-like GTPase activity (Roadblock/LC7/MglB family)